MAQTNFRSLSVRALVAAMLLTLASTAPSHAGAPDADRDRAREFFLEGDALFKKELYDSAIENFKKANALYPHPINLYNIARGYEKLGDGESCVKFYNDYIDFSRRENNGRDPKDLVDVRASIAKCQLLQKPEVTITSDPPGASVYLDDRAKLVGQTPITLKLDPGKYRLFLNHDGYSPFEQELQVSSGQPLKLAFKLEKFQRVGTVRVKSNVRGASVFIDGRNIGLTPYTELITLDEGPHQVAISKDEYLPFNREIEVVVDGTQELTAELYLRDAPVTWKGYLGWTAIALGAGAGVSGYFLGAEADKYFSGTKNFKKWSNLQKIGYGAGGGLAGVGLLLVILEAFDNEIVKDADVLDPVAGAPLRITPFVSADGLVGADVRF